MHKIILIVVGLLIIAVASYAAFFYTPTPAPAPAHVTSFEECADAGNPVMESYPRQCTTPEGVHFTENIVAEIPDVVSVTFPTKGAGITSPLNVTGKARGPWYFEASFPIEVLNASGTVIGQGYAEAQSDWMTTEFVNFKSINITFPPQPSGSKGTVVLHKDNPSGLPEHAQSLEIPVSF